MVSSEVQRTLVKSPPELWAELSDPAALARHLGELGEIRIVKTKPEERVEWESDGASGTVLIKASGWGTKVTLSVTREVARAEEPDVEAEPPTVADTTPVLAEPEIEADAKEPAPEPVLERRRGFLARLFRRRSQPGPELRATAEPEPAPRPPASGTSLQASDAETAEPSADISAELRAAEEAATEAVTAALTAALDRLGAAHHRPFSRA